VTKIFAQSCGCFEKLLNEKKAQNVRQQFEIALIQWFLTGGTPPQEALINFLEGIIPFHALQHGKFLNGKVLHPNVTSVLILHSYILLGLAPAEIEVVLKFF